jgi:hypothetical protein
MFRGLVRPIVRPEEVLFGLTKDSRMRLDRVAFCRSASAREMH